MKLKLNVVAVEQRKAEEDAREKPMPKVRVKRKSAPGKPQVTIAANTEPARQKLNAVVKDSLISELTDEMAKLRRERGKLSSEIAQLVVDTEAALMKESPGIAQEFQNGNLPVPELAAHYGRIQNLTEKMGQVFTRLRHVERYGELPQEEKVELRFAETSADVKVMLYEIRRLDDLIHKTTKKLKQNNAGLKKPRNIAKIVEWKEKIALAEVRRFELKQKLKRMQYETNE